MAAGFACAMAAEVAQEENPSLREHDGLRLACGCSSAAHGSAPGIYLGIPEARLRNASHCMDTCCTTMWHGQQKASTAQAWFRVGTG